MPSTNNKPGQLLNLPCHISTSSSRYTMIYNIHFPGLNGANIWIYLIKPMMYNGSQNHTGSAILSMDRNSESRLNSDLLDWIRIRIYEKVEHLRFCGICTLLGQTIRPLSWDCPLPIYPRYRTSACSQSVWWYTVYMYMYRAYTPQSIYKFNLLIQHWNNITNSCIHCMIC